MAALAYRPSSRRFKKAIEPMDKASEAILALKPVRFQYKTDGTNTPQFGLIAEHCKVEKQEHKLQEQDRSIQNQQATVEELKEEIRRLTETVKVEASEIQKVSARLQMIDPAATRVAADHR